MVDFSLVSDLVQGFGWDRDAEQTALVEAFAGTGYIIILSMRRKHM